MTQRCPSCQQETAGHDQFCERCGVPRTRGPIPADVRPVAPGPAPPVRDESTRYLCAAAHLDPAFADEVIAEFLVEPVRAVASSPGADTTAVLRDAVAAWTRRRVRDGLLVALLVAYAFVSPSLFGLWLVVAIAVAGAVELLSADGRRDVFAVAAFAAAGPAVVAAARHRGEVARPNALALLGVDVLAALGLLAVAYVLGMFLFGLGPFALIDGSLALALVIAVVMGLVLVTDEFTVHHLVGTCFRSSRFVADGERSSSPWERRTRYLGHAAFGGRLAAVAEADRQTADPNWADVVVHRGYNPFVGAGDVIKQQIIALPLDPGDKREGSQPGPISVIGLHGHIADAMETLRKATSLGPDGRLLRLARREWVVMSAEELVRKRHDQPSPPVLVDLAAPPMPWMRVDDARRIGEIPREWARYYQCYRIESWDRELATSCFLHIGTDQRMLFLEWTFCALLPVQGSYRDIDRYRSGDIAVLGRALLRLVMLPMTLIRRTRTALHRFVRILQEPDEVVPDRYGSASSVRELAAAGHVRTYFQFVDVIRYTEIIDAALVRAVGDYLQKRGYSVVEFQRQAQTPTFDLRGAQGVAFGQGSSVSNNAFGPRPATQKDQR